MSTIQIGRVDVEVQAVTTAGTSLVGATPLLNGINILTTAASQTAGLLPQNNGAPIIVRNNTATAALIFPPTALGSINGGSAGASFSVAQNKPTVFYPHPNGIDYTAVLSA